jgi:hypothetical protein
MDIFELSELRINNFFRIQTNATHPSAIEEKLLRKALFFSWTEISITRIDHE